MASRHINRLKKAHLRLTWMRDINNALNVECIQSFLLEVLLFSWIFNPSSNHEKSYWSFQMTSDLMCLETYRNIKTMHCSVTWINLVTWIKRLCNHSYLTENLSCTKLRSGSTFISLGKYYRFLAGKVNRKVSHLVHTCIPMWTDFEKISLYSL